MEQQLTSSPLDGKNGESLTRKERKQLRREEKLAARVLQGKRQVFSRVLTWALCLVVFAGVIVGLVVLAGRNNGSSPADATPTEDVLVDDWVKGPAEASLTLIEYSDFQCPACASFHPMLELLTKEFGNDLRFVYRHFPLAQHKQAKLAAYAAEAAGKQGKFWEMHDMIFENQEEWAEKENARDIFVGYAEKLQLGLGEFTTDIWSQEIQDKVQKQLEMGQKANVSATPTFYLNGSKIATNPRSYEEFKELFTVEKNSLLQATVEIGGEEQTVPVTPTP